MEKKESIKKQEQDLVYLKFKKLLKSFFITWLKTYKNLNEISQKEKINNIKNELYCLLKKDKEFKSEDIEKYIKKINELNCEEERENISIILNILKKSNKEFKSKDILHILKNEINLTNSNEELAKKIRDLIIEIIYKIIEEFELSEYKKKKIILFFKKTKNTLLDRINQMLKWDFWIIEKSVFLCWEKHKVLYFSRNFYETLFDNILEKEVKKWIYVWIIDLDFFKHINDIFWHFFADKILIDVMKNFNKYFDISIRYWWEEFIVLFKNKESISSFLESPKIKINLWKIDKIKRMFKNNENYIVKKIIEKLEEIIKWNINIKSIKIWKYKIEVIWNKIQFSFIEDWKEIDIPWNLEVNWNNNINFNASFTFIYSFINDINFIEEIKEKIDNELIKSKQRNKRGNSYEILNIK